LVLIVPHTTTPIGKKNRYAEFRNMRSQQLTPPGIQSKSTDVLRIFLASFGTTKTLEEANAEFIEAKNTALLLASAPASVLLGS